MLRRLADTVEIAGECRQNVDGVCPQTRLKVAPLSLQGPCSSFCRRMHRLSQGRISLSMVATMRLGPKGWEKLQLLPVPLSETTRTWNVL